MRTNPLILSILVSLLIVSAGFTNTAKAVEPLSLKEFNYLCKDYHAHPNQSESMQCARYIKGFIDGAIAADVGVNRKQVEEEDSGQTFSERAISTRIGNRINQFAPSESSNFCLGNPVSIADVIGTVTEKIKAIEDQERSALVAMFQILIDNYPCTEKP